MLSPHAHLNTPQTSIHPLSRSPHLSNELYLVPGRPRQIDTQDTVPLGRGASLVSDFRNAEVIKMASRDPVLDLVSQLQARGDLEMAVPDDVCLDMEKSPGKLSEWVYRNGEMSVEDRAFEALKWTRIVAQYHEAKFELQDGVHGAMARSLHETSLALLGYEKSFRLPRLTMRKP